MTYPFKPETKEKIYSTGMCAWAFNRPVDFNGPQPIRWMQGPCPRCGSPTSTYGTSYSCHNYHCGNSASHFICGPDRRPEWWNTEVNVIRDGDKWRASKGDYISVRESIVGWGETPDAAVNDLIKNLLPHNTKS